MNQDIIPLFPVKHPFTRPVTETRFVALPTQGRAEREHLYDWITGEEQYVAGKFDDQRQGHDDDLRDSHLERTGFWFRQITQYYDRARIAFQAAAECRADAESYDESFEQSGNPAEEDQAQDLRRDARMLEMKGQQALAKAFMTAKGCVESSIRVFGPLPKPGLSSGYVEEWT